MLIKIVKALALIVASLALMLLAMLPALASGSAFMITLIGISTLIIAGCFAGMALHNVFVEV